MRWSLALAAILAFALVPIARADDPPGLALAKQVVEQLRGDAHRQKMRIVWPEHVEETPSEGAEVVLITGYIDYTLTRFVWHAGKVEARSVTTTRTWFRHPKGESYGARGFDVDPAEFASAWAAARFVAGARDERGVPRPEGLPHGSSMTGRASHESSRYIRLRLPDSAAPLHVSDRCTRSRDAEGIVPWEEIRDRSTFQLFEPMLPKKDAARALAVTTFSGVVLDEIRRATEHLDRTLRADDRLALEVSLRIGGEVGDEATLQAVDALDAALRADPRSDRSAQWARTLFGREIETARTKLGLRVRWDSATATRLLRSDSVAANSQYDIEMRDWHGDLETWIRRRFREQDPVEYLALAVEEFERGELDGEEDLLATVAALRLMRPVGAGGAFRGLFAHRDVAIRIQAARALLDMEPADAEARSVLRAAIDDVHDPIVSGPPGMRWGRVDALNAAVETKILAAKDLRERLASDRSDHAFFIRALLDALTGLGEPATRDEELAAWRRVLEGPLEFEVRTAVRELIALKDTPSRGRIVAALDRLAQESMKDVADRKVFVDADIIEGLRRELDERIPAEPVPK